MRLLFLDFDGVLNCTSTTQRLKWEDGRMTGLEPRFVALLQSLLQQTDADVVVSSAWREIFTLGQLVRFLEDAGLEHELGRRFVGVTPSLQRMSDTSASARAYQIRLYLQEHPTDRFVTLDDIDLTERFLTAVTVADGLTQDDVEHAVFLLAACHS